MLIYLLNYLPASQRQEANQVGAICFLIFDMNTVVLQVCVSHVYAALDLLGILTLARVPLLTHLDLRKCAVWLPLLGKQRLFSFTLNL